MHKGPPQLMLGLSGNLLDEFAHTDKIHISAESHKTPLICLENMLYFYGDTLIKTLYELSFHLFLIILSKCLEHSGCPVSSSL